MPKKYICKRCKHEFEHGEFTVPRDCPECMSMFVATAPRPQDSLGSGELNCYKPFENLAEKCPLREHLKCRFANDTADHQYGKCCVENCGMYYWATAHIGL